MVNKDYFNNHRTPSKVHFTSDNGCESDDSYQEEEIPKEFLD